MSSDLFRSRLRVFLLDAGYTLEAAVPGRTPAGGLPCWTVRVTRRSDGTERKIEVVGSGELVSQVMLSKTMAAVEGELS